MPRKKRRLLERRGLTEDQQNYLMDGWCLDPSSWSDPTWSKDVAGRPMPFRSVEEMREVWKLHKAEMMAAAPRGKKPWAWHQFEKDSGSEI